MKKNLFRVAMLFTFAFMLTRMQVGGTKLYYGQQGQSTANFNEACVFNTIGEVYNAQTNTKEEWEIESIK